MSEDFPFNTPPMSAPPVAPASMTQPPARSTWPTAVGILAIVFGALGILAGASGFVSPMIEDAIVSSVPAEQAEEAQQTVESYRPLTIVIACVMVALGIVLLISGIGLVHRRRGSVRRLRIWASLKIPVVLVELAVNAMYLLQMPDADAGQPGTGFAMAGLLEGMMMMSLLVVAVVWSCAGPVFVLVWFSRKSIKAEVADWA